MFNRARGIVRFRSFRNLMEVATKRPSYVWLWHLKVMINYSFLQLVFKYGNNVMMISANDMDNPAVSRLDFERSLSECYELRDRKKIIEDVGHYQVFQR